MVYSRLHILKFRERLEIMMAWRWLSLRLFWSLILLPFAAAPVLTLLHQRWFPGAYFQDAPVVFLLWLLLFTVCHWGLTRLGVRRLQRLNDLGWEFLEKSNEYLTAEIFAQVQRLLAGGLLSGRRRAEFEKEILFRYFDFYLARIEQPQFRKKLRRCLREQIHLQRAYAALKEYVLRQEELDLEIADIAEELLEYQPDEDLALFMAERYLAERQTHFRAERFYQALLEKAHPLSEKILSLCLENAVRAARLDDFAGWLYARAWSGLDEDLQERVARLLYRMHQRFQAARRKDALAAEVGRAVDLLPQPLQEQLEAEREAHQARSLRRMAERAAFQLQQSLLTAVSYLRIYRHYVAYAAVLISFGLMVYLFLPAGEGSFFANHEKAQTPVLQEGVTVQVAATKSRKAAQREVARLKRAGVDAYLVEPGRGGRFYKIRVGRFATRAEAETAARALLRKKLIREYFLVNFKAKKGAR